MEKDDLNKPFLRISSNASKRLSCELRCSFGIHAAN